MEEVDQITDLLKVKGYRPRIHHSIEDGWIIDNIIPEDLKIDIKKILPNINFVELEPIKNR